MAVKERWVGAEDVAAHLGVAKDSVYRWIEEQGLPAHRVGRLYRFKLSEIDDWVRQDDAQRTAPGLAQNQSPSKSQSKKMALNKPPQKRDGNE
ncbi:MAG: helix-turn-helix domain-containing protein [Desulfobacteraceae bacterium]|jgi:excisionase family DNA binding protein